MKFDIDANGILSVTAVEKRTGKKQNITITSASTLPSDDVCTWKKKCCFEENLVFDYVLKLEIACFDKLLVVSKTCTVKK